MKRLVLVASVAAIITTGLVASAQEQDGGEEAGADDEATCDCDSLETSVSYWRGKFKRTARAHAKANAAGRAMYLAHHLDLDEAQVQKVKRLFAQKERRFLAIKREMRTTDTKTGNEGPAEGKEVVRQRVERRLEEILNADQFAAYEKLERWRDVSDDVSLD